MDIRIECPCGQAYKFSVEPVNDLMPCPVACPACGADGTQLANQFIRSTAAPAAIPIPPPAAIPRPPAPSPPPPPPARTGMAALPRPQSTASDNNIGLGILGAVLGAAVGAGLMYGFFLWTGFRFPLFGVGIGALTGGGARILYRGTDTSLGVMAAVISLATTMGSLYFMFGDLAVMFIVSMLVSAYVAYRIAS